MFDTSYALKDYLGRMSKEQIETFIYVIIFNWKENFLFMTEDNWYEFAWELSSLTNTLFTGRAFSEMNKLSKEQLEYLHLKYINLNVILADNIGERILEGQNIEEIMSYISNTVYMKCMNRYKMTVLI